MTQRNLAFAAATLDNIGVVGGWIEHLPDDEGCSRPWQVYQQSKFKTLVENIKQYLSIAKNNAGVPMLYAIRIAPGLPADDPGFAQPSLDIELSLRGRHDGPFWRSTNRLVWNMIRSVCHGTEAWNHIKRFAVPQDGRGAFLALMHTYMGADIQYNIRSAAEQVLQRLVFDGRSRNFTFDNFTGKFKAALNELAELNMSEETKVMKFRNAFQVKEFAHLAQYHSHLHQDSGQFGQYYCFCW